MQTNLFLISQNVFSFSPCNSKHQITQIFIRKDVTAMKSTVDHASFFDLNAFFNGDKMTVVL